jgi:Leucine-rich repeat (LRR) protein
LKIIALYVSQAFVRYNTLQELDLSNCGLQTIDTTSISGLRSLQTIDLSNNALTALSTFHGLSSLNHVYMDFNRFTTLNSSSFGTLSNVTYLSLSQNHMRSISSDAFNLLLNLSTLMLNGNELTDIPYAALSKLDKLRNLYMDSNPMQTMPPSNSTVSVTMAMLSGMPVLTSVGAGAFSGFPKLEEVRMWYSINLTSINEHTFAPNAARVKSAYLNGNQFTTMGEGLLSWETMENLDIGGNPYNCNSSLCWILDKRAFFEGFMSFLNVT